MCDRGPSDSVRRWVAAQGAERLDQYITACIEQLSRSQVQRLLRAGRVTVNDGPAKAAGAVRAGDVIEVLLPPRTTLIQAEPLSLAVVYESADIVVVDKPAGQLVHPTSEERTGTLVNAMLWHYPEIAGVGPEGRQGVVHRLDRGTSGLVMFGRTQRGLRSAQEQFREHQVWKTYVALVAGSLRPARGLIDAPVGRHPRDRTRMAVVRAGGRSARTQYEVLEDFDGYSLLKVHPLTGRTHQIRVHLAAVGHPVAGDPTYGRGVADLGLSRQFLHATGLRFTDPAVGRAVEVDSPLPGDLQRVLEVLSDGQ